MSLGKSSRYNLELLRLYLNTISVMSRFLFALRLSMYSRSSYYEDALLIDITSAERLKFRAQMWCDDIVLG